MASLKQYSSSEVVTSAMAVLRRRRIHLSSLLRSALLMSVSEIITVYVSPIGIAGIIGGAVALTLLLAAAWRRSTRLEVHWVHALLTILLYAGVTVGVTFLFLRTGALASTAMPVERANTREAAKTTRTRMRREVLCRFILQATLFGNHAAGAVAAKRRRQRRCPSARMV